VLERWLRGYDDEKFARAAMACEGHRPECVYRRKCLRDGICFRSENKARRLASRLIRSLAVDQPPDIAAHMTEAAKFIVAPAEAK